MFWPAPPFSVSLPAPPSRCVIPEAAEDGVIAVIALQVVVARATIELVTAMPPVITLSRAFPVPLILAAVKVEVLDVGAQYVADGAATPSAPSLAFSRNDLLGAVDKVRIVACAAAHLVVTNPAIEHVVAAAAV